MIVALGRQDLDTDGIVVPDDYARLGSSSDHLVLDCTTDPPDVGGELRFGLNYSALMRSMASPFVTRRYVGGGDGAGSPDSPGTART